MLGKRKNITNYYISFETIILQPIIREGGGISTRIIERNKEFIIPRKPIQIVKKSCNYYNGSLKNSINASKNTLGHRHKTPIIVASDFGMPFIFLPTMSPSSPHNVWIALHAIENMRPDKMGGCVIYLDNDISIKVNVSITTMQRQHSMGSILEKDFQKKHSRLNRPSFYNPYDEGKDDDDDEQK